MYVSLAEPNFNLNHLGNPMVKVSSCFIFEETEAYYDSVALTQDLRASKLWD